MPPKPANDNRQPRFKGGLPPCIAKLARVDPEGAWSVLEFGRVHDIAPTVDGEAGDIDEFAPDARHEIKPTVEEMLADVLRPRVVRHCDGTITRHGGPDDIQFDGEVARLGSLVFHLRKGMRRAPAGGNLVAYVDERGKPQTPQIIARKARRGKGATPEAWKPFNAEGYLRLRGTPMPESAPAPYDNMGRPPMKPQRDFPLSFAPTVCPPAVAAGAHWLGGTTRGTPSTPTPAQLPDRPDVPGGVAYVLELALSRSTYQQLGEAVGYRGGYADRAGKRAFLGAVEEAKRLFPAPRRVEGWQQHLAKLRGEPDVLAA